MVVAFHTGRVALFCMSTLLPSLLDAAVTVPCERFTFSVNTSLAPGLQHGAQLCCSVAAVAVRLWSQLSLCTALQGELDLAHLQQLLSSGKVKLVACAHMSNVLGTIHPIRKVCRLHICAFAHVVGTCVWRALECSR